jgi:hypothetical protein
MGDRAGHVRVQLLQCSIDHYLRGARRACQQTVRPGAGVASALAIGDILADPVRFSV